MDNLGSYKDLSDKIDAIKAALKIEDKQIAKWVKNCLKGSSLEIDGLKTDQKEEIKEFIASVTYLLFGTEVARNPASILMHQMMLDLIEGGKNSFKDFFDNAQKEYKGGLMPMSAKGAISAARLANKEFFQHLPYQYQYPGVEGDNDGKSTALVTKTPEFLLAEYNLAKKWLEYRLNGRVGNRDELVGEFLTEIQKAAEEWYPDIFQQDQSQDIVHPMQSLLLEDGPITSPKNPSAKRCQSQRIDGVTK